MRHATRDWLRRRHVLLLAPLLLASSASALPATGFRVVWHSAPPAATAGVAAPFTVEAVDLLGGVDTTFTGTATFSSSDPSATLPPDTDFTEADQGRKTFFITFRRAATHTLTVRGTLLNGSLEGVRVEPGPTQRFRVDSLPTSTVAGQAHDFKVIPEDAFGNWSKYTGTLSFSSGDPRAVVTPIAPADSTYSITFKTAGAWALSIFDADDPRIGGEVASLEVAPGQFDRIVLAAFPSTQVPACGPVTLTLTAEDAFGNRVTVFPTSFTFCATSNHSATVIESLGTVRVTREALCYSGSLPTTGTGTVVFENMQDERVTFRSNNGTTPTEITIEWMSGVFSPDRSRLSFSDGSREPFELSAPTGRVGLRFEVRDTCGGSMDLPTTQTLSFTGDPPLRIGPLERTGEGQWTASVGLPECPETGEAPLSVWPTLDDAPVHRLNGDRIQVQIRPRCSPPVVELSVRPEKGDVAPSPGALVDFIVELENKGEVVIVNGLIHLSVEGMTVLEASLDGQPLTASGDGFVLPKLPLDTRLTVKIKAQVTAKLDQPATARVWYATASGTPLTEAKVVRFDMEELGVDVGCGCHAGDLPSQSLALLALLLAASRPRGRSRRLARGERNEH
jgi:hypothetical protein